MERLVAFTLVLLAGYCQASQRIIGGDVASVADYPSIVQVEFLNRWTEVWSQSCAATIINNLNVLSAANCFAGTDYQPDSRRVRAGADYRNTGGIVIYVYRAVNHPSFDSDTLENDISVVRLTEPLIFSPTIQPGYIPPEDTVLYAGIPVSQLGWGLTGEQETSSSVLLRTDVYIINTEVCRERYQSTSTSNQVSDNNICTGLLDVGGRGSCLGDNGGPLTLGVVTVGVISWGEGCGHQTLPGVNTAVAPYTNWVIEVAQSLTL